MSKGLLEGTDLDPEALAAPGACFCVVGGHGALGGWDPKQAPQLRPAGDAWEGAISVAGEEFKFCRSAPTARHGWEASTTARRTTTCGRSAGRCTGCLRRASGCGRSSRTPRPTP